MRSSARAYFEKHDRPRVPPDLLKHPCIRVRLPNGALYRWEFEKGGQSAQIDVSGPITLDEASLARTTVLEGIGLGFFMEQYVLADILEGRLVRVLQDWTPPFAGLCLYYPGRRNRRLLSRLSSAWPAYSPPVIERHASRSWPSSERQQQGLRGHGA